MNIAGNILSILLLAGIAIQDFRSRSISVWLLQAIVVTMLMAAIGRAEISVLLYPDFTINVALLTFQLVVLWLFVSFRRKAWTNIINSHIGAGDILLLVCLTPFFSPVNYFVLFTTSSILALLMVLLMRVLKQKTEEYIPFAGVLGLPLMVLCALRLILPDVVVFTNSDWFYNFLV